MWPWEFITLITSQLGTINGFGSIFVNGVEFETDEADILVDGQRVGEDALGLGMVVLVDGTVNEDGVTGTANSVVFDDEVEGPIEAIQPGQDGEREFDDEPEDEEEPEDEAESEDEPESESEEEPEPEEEP